MPHFGEIPERPAPDDAATVLAGQVFGARKPAITAASGGIPAFTSLAISGGAVAVNASATGNFYLSLTSNCTLSAPTGMVDGQRFCFVVQQDSTGGRDITGYASIYVFPNAAKPTLSTSAFAEDRFDGIYNATLGAIFLLPSYNFGPFVLGTTWNPSDGSPNIARFAFTNVNRTITKAGAGSVCDRGTNSRGSGAKVYFEVVCVAIGGTNTAFIPGVITAAATLADVWTSNTTDFVYRANGQSFINGGATNPFTGATYTTGDVIGFACNIGTNIAVYKNNVLQGTATYTSVNICPYMNADTGGSGQVATIHTTAATCTYTPPSGFAVWG